MRLHPTLLPLLLALPLAAAAQQRAPERTEWDVQASDGGLTLRGFAAPDGGTAGPALEPPTLLVDSPAPYPEALQASPVTGTVQLQLLVDEQGRVAEVALETGLHPLLDAAAQQAARGLAFAPARLDGAAVAVRIPFSYHFTAPPPPVAPTGTLQLEVRAKATRERLAGAQVLDARGAPLGETDAEGRLTLTLPAGEHTLAVHATGHRSATFTEKVAAGDALQLVYRLEPLEVDPYRTVVRGERERSVVARTTLSAQELRETPGTMGDPFRVVMLMPGVASVASGVSYPVVRGAQPAATGYFVDGVRVPVLFHLLLGPSVVHPDSVDRLDFTPGLPPLRHGRLMAGAVEAHLRRPEPGVLHGTASVDFINAGAMVTGVVPQTGTEVTVGGRFSYTGLIAARVAGALSQPDGEGYRTQPVADFYDYTARLEQAVGPGRVRLLALGSSDSAGSDSLNPRGTDMMLVTRFHRLDLRYRQPAGVGEAEVAVTGGVQDVGVLSAWGESRRDYLLSEAELSARASWSGQVREDLTLTLGADANRRGAGTTITERLEGDTRDTTTALDVGRGQGLQAGAYAELAWQPTEAWTVTGGARADSHHLFGGVQHASVDPRLTARYQLSPSLALEAGTGLVHQAPTVLLPLPVLDLNGLRYGLQEAVQVDAGAEWQPAPGWELRVDGYFTRLTRAVEFDVQQLFEAQRRQGRAGSDPGTTGHAYGVEVLARRHLGGSWFGWVSYSLQRSTRRRTFLRFDEAGRPLGEATADLPFAFDQTHNANAALSYRFPGNLTVGANLHFHTGRPESGQLSSRTMRESVDPATGAPTWLPVDRDQVDRLPSFFRVDVRLAKRWAFDDSALELSLDVQNASLSREVLAYQYFVGPTFFDNTVRARKQVTEIPIVVPQLGLKATF